MMNPTEIAYLSETEETLRVMVTVLRVGLTRDINMVWVFWRARPYLKKATAHMLHELLDCFYLDDAIAVGDCLEAHRKQLGKGDKAAAALTAELLYCFGWRYGVGEGLIRLLSILGQLIGEARTEGKAIDLSPLWTEIADYFMHAPESKKVHIRKEDIFLAVRFSASAGRDRKSRETVQKMNELLSHEYSGRRWPLKKNKEDIYMDAIWPLVVEERETIEEHEAEDVPWKENVS